MARRHKKRRQNRLPATDHNASLGTEPHNSGGSYPDCPAAGMAVVDPGDHQIDRGSSSSSNIAAADIEVEVDEQLTTFTYLGEDAELSTAMNIESLASIAFMVCYFFYLFVVFLIFAVFIAIIFFVATIVYLLSIAVGNSLRQ